MASSSSMKMMQGAWALACSNRSRTRAAPTPTNISTNSLPLSEKKGTPASPATARAISVLPVPGGPTKQNPLGDLRPQGLVAAGILEEIDHLLQLVLGLVAAGHVGEGHAGVLVGHQPRLAPPEAHHRLAGLAQSRGERKNHSPTKHGQRQQPGQQELRQRSWAARTSI